MNWAIVIPKGDATRCIATIQAAKTIKRLVDRTARFNVWADVTHIRAPYEGFLQGLSINRWKMFDFGRNVLSATSTLLRHLDSTDAILCGSPWVVPQERRPKQILTIGTIKEPLFGLEIPWPFELSVAHEETFDWSLGNIRDASRYKTWLVSEDTTEAILSWAKQLGSQILVER